MRVSVVGSGYVGLTTGVVLAYVGHQVELLDVDEGKISRLRDGQIPIYERGLLELFTAAKSNLTFCSGWNEFNPTVDVIMIAVGTPPKQDGQPDFTYVESVLSELGDRLTLPGCGVVALKSTVPVGSLDWAEQFLRSRLEDRNCYDRLHLAYNPEFLREGEAVYDALYPDRIVVGTESDYTASTLRRLYRPVLEQSFSAPDSIAHPTVKVTPPFLVMKPRSAEMVKYAANSFLALKISFANEFATLAEHVGADITEVVRALGHDNRIGQRFLQPGVGWGGSCFGKDIQAILSIANRYDCAMEIMNAAMEVNSSRRDWVVRKLTTFIGDLCGKQIGLLGLAFKPNTDDVRDAVSIHLVQKLLDLGALVKVYDPVAVDNCKHMHPDLAVVYAERIEDLFQGCDAVVLVTEWNEFKTLRLKDLGLSMNQQVMIDGRNALDVAALTEAGFSYARVGGAEVWREASWSLVEQVSSAVTSLNL